MWQRCPFAILIVLLGTTSAWAHALGAECRIESGRVIVEAYFSDNTPGRDASVIVRDKENTVIQGRTDDNGRWSFVAPPPGRYEVIVDAGMGHRITVEFTVSASAVVSEGPSRDDFTRTPWFRIVLGLVLISVLAIALRWWMRHRRATTLPNN